MTDVWTIASDGWQSDERHKMLDHARAEAMAYSYNNPGVSFFVYRNGEGYPSSFTCARADKKTGAAIHVESAGINAPSATTRWWALKALADSEQNKPEAGTPTNPPTNPSEGA